MKNLNLLQNWYVIDIQTAKSKSIQNISKKFNTKSIKSSLLWLFWRIYFSCRRCKSNCRQWYTDVAFKNCAPFSICKTEVNVFIDEANHIYITMPMYNFIEYSNNYSDTSGSLLQFKRDEVPANNAGLAL